MNMITGKSGVIEFYISMALALNNGRKTEEVIRQEVFEKTAHLEEGVYEVSGSGLNYLGLYNKDKGTGHYAVDCNGVYTVEQWDKGWRTYKKIISKEEFNQLTTIKT